MSWLFGQTWIWYLIAFAVGVLLAWLLFVLPAQRRLRRLEAGGGARPADDQTSVLDLIKGASGARIRIDGYVAAGPGDGRLTAQQLSDARAATVRDALVAGGVPADRIAVRGLGEGTSPAQTAAARRVEITVV